MTDMTAKALATQLILLNSNWGMSNEQHPVLPVAIVELERGQFIIDFVSSKESLTNHES